MDNKTIESQLSANAKALEWGRVYLRGQELESFRNALISNRIKLKHLRYANDVNPAAAIFGESQVGKSYMVDCLLTSDTETLNVYDSEGHPTSFIKSINPIGGGKEATSLISRFTTKQVWIDKEYPVRASMLSPIDVVLVITDSYYNDVTNHDMPKAEAIKAEIEHLKAKYQALPNQQSYITEDEIYELRDYLNSDLVLRCDGFRAALIDNKYFEELALIIQKVGVKQWADVFSFLWNHQPILTDTFSQLINTLEKMDFSRDVYIKIDAVLRDPGTILHVDRIYELFGITEVQEKGQTVVIQTASEPYMDVLTPAGKKLTGISKSEFCLLATELAFTIVDVNNKDGITRFHSKKPFLEYSDILDFPGARSRLLFNAATIINLDVCQMMIRGKIAYLFNKYSQQFMITNLLFCHHDTQSNVATLSSLLKGWVFNTVGASASERQKFMDTAEISPLFLIGTKFNIDLGKTQLEKNSAEEARKMTNKDYRWSKRFGILSNLIAASAENDWFTNWTPGEAFKNLYLLRAYDYSAGIFKGFMEQGPDGAMHIVRKPDGTIRGETGIEPEYVDFIADMRKSFLSKDNKFVQEHFKDPEVSWNMAVCEGENGSADWVGRDGSEWIIKNLTKSSRNTTRTRNTQFMNINKNLFETLVKTLYDLYHDDNTDLELKKQVHTAGMIALTFDTLFGKDKYFFSDFISSMLISEEDLHDVVLDVINKLEVVDKTDLSMLFAIRAHAEVNNNLPFEENVSRMMRAYDCSSQQELEDMLNERGVSIDDVINPPKVMNFSRLIADAVEKEWLDTRLNIENYKEFINRGLSEKELKELLENMRALYKEKLKISDRIATKIHPFVSSAISVDDMTDMLADICAEMINKYINTMGSAYYSQEMWDNLKDTIAHNGFKFDIPDEKVDEVKFDDEKVREDLPNVFDTFDNVDKILNEVPVNMEKLRHFSNYQEYYKWREVMRISFLATQGIPKYDVNMNNALREIFVKAIMGEDSMKELIDANDTLRTIKTIQNEDN